MSSHHYSSILASLFLQYDVLIFATFVWYQWYYIALTKILIQSNHLTFCLFFWFSFVLPQTQLNIAISHKMNPREVLCSNSLKNSGMAIVWPPAQLAILIRFPSSKVPRIQIGATVIIRKCNFKTITIVHFFHTTHFVSSRRSSLWFPTNIENFQTVQLHLISRIIGWISFPILLSPGMMYQSQVQGWNIREDCEVCSTKSLENANLVFNQYLKKYCKSLTYGIS